MRAAGLSAVTSSFFKAAVRNRVVLVRVWQMKALLCTLIIMYNLNRSVLIGAPYWEVVGDFSTPPLYDWVQKKSFQNSSHLYYHLTVWLIMKQSLK